MAAIPEEAERVRYIFSRYLELGSVHALMRDLRERNIVSKQKLLKTGAICGGVPFERGPLFYLLRNRFYIGEVSYKGQIYPGEQPPILDRALFDRVQTTLSEQWTHRTRTRTSFHHLLTGLIFDDAGHRMAPTHAQKNGRRYSYYVSRPLLFGNAATADVGSVSRAPAADIDNQVRKVVLEPRHQKLKSTNPVDNAFACSVIDRIEVQKKRLVVQLKQDPDDPTEDHESTIIIPWTKPPSKRMRSILRPTTTTKLPLRPMKLERRATLIAAIARGRRWLDELIANSATDAQAIAKREHCSLRHINMTLSLAFLSPALVRAAVEGRLPRGIGVARLRELPLAWDRQFEALALDPI